MMHSWKWKKTDLKCKKYPVWTHSTSKTRAVTPSLWTVVILKIEASVRRAIRKCGWNTSCVDQRQTEIHILRYWTCGFSLIDSPFLLLQHVRLLSRKQFQLRALMQKARKTAGLSDLYWHTPTTWKHSYSHALSYSPLFLLCYIPFFNVESNSCPLFNLYNTCSCEREIWTATTQNWTVLFSTVTFQIVWATVPVICILIRPNTSLRSLCINSQPICKTLEHYLCVPY